MREEVETDDEAELISGGDGIARFLFGVADDRSRREVYHLAENHDLPAFKVGAKLYARRRKLLEWIKARERGDQAPRP